ncbi:haloacid dehalogenase [Planctomyces sp. SCGC AG-212-M04]|nr:haloacid dehalogenase [Planctomyces sp. SCGC AG-212-M04]
MLRRVLVLLTASSILHAASVHSDDATLLPSWNDGPPRSAILSFVDKVTREGSADFIRPEDRVAVFDNDGTLWCEQPLYFQALFMFDRIRELAPQHPEWKQTQPFAAVLSGDHAALAHLDAKALDALMASTHAGMTTDEFAAIVKKWLSTSRHPKYHRPYTELIYQPMLEVLAHLRAKGFKTFIVSGGGVDFMRVFAARAYGIPPEQVIGSSVKTKFELRDGQPVLVKLPDIGSIDDHAGKPVNIHLHIGRRPIMAFGNSDGDLEMLQWTTIAKATRFGLIVHHTDADREYVYDRNSHVGQLNKALDEAPKRGWVVVDMKTDWKRIFPE